MLLLRQASVHLRKMPSGAAAEKVHTCTDGLSGKRKVARILKDEVCVKPVTAVTGWRTQSGNRKAEMGLGKGKKMGEVIMEGKR